MKLETAILYADLLTAAAAPHCMDGRCLIAGSIRRQRPEVNDIELVAIPRQGAATAFWSAIIGQGWTPATKVTAQSRYVRLKRATEHGNIPLDVFVPQRHDWGRILAIRTGPSDYSARLAHAWVKLGYRGTEVGLLLETLCRRKGDKWEPSPNIEPRPVHFLSEAAFFEFIKLEWVEPHKRF